MQKPLNTQLPADLPENWQTGQVVSPTGIDVGLTAKHGYNYQSQQINDTQQAINDINDAFEDVQGNLEDISTDTSIVDADTVPIVKSDSTKKRISFTTIVSAIKSKLNSVYAAIVHSHGNISNNGNLGSSANQAAYTSASGKLIAGTLPIAAGGTGKTSFTVGQVLVGNGTGALAQKAIDTTQGGTADSEALITSGAVKAALNAGAVVSAPKLATPRTIALSGGATGTATSFDGTGNISIPVTALSPSYLSGSVPVSKGGTGITNLNVGKLKADTNADSFIEIYLSPTGNDTATGLSTGAAMKTIRAALGKYGGLNRIRLNLAAGTYTDSTTLVVSGNTYVDISGPQASAGTAIITHPIIFQSCDAKFLRVSFNLSSSTETYPALTFRQCKYDIQECIFNGKATVHAGINVSLGSSGYIWKCTFQTGIRGVEIGSGASMTAIECSFTNTFEIGFNVNGGLLISSRTTNNAKSSFAMYSSAVIFNDGLLLNQASNVVATAEFVE